MVQEKTSIKAWEPIRLWEFPILAICLLAFVAQLVLSSPHKSAAFDEPYHLTAGYAYLKTGDFRLSRTIGHPPLVNLISALPLLVKQNIELPLDHPAWEIGNYEWFSDAFLWQGNADPQGLIVLGRLGITILGAMTVLVVFIWARQLAGAVASWVALLLAVLDPNLLANSRLITTDLGLTFFVLLAVWRFWSWLENPTPVNLTLAGLASGMTMASKYTGLVIWPIFFVLVLIYPGHSLRNLGKLLLMALIAYGVVWAVYRFEVGPIPDLAISLPFPAPTYPAAVWSTFTFINENPVTAYLLGQISQDGWWYYFPVALVVKTPITLLLLSIVGLIITLRRLGWRRAAALWLPPASFMALAMVGPFNIGYRHILQVVPFLILLASHVALLPVTLVRVRGKNHAPNSLKEFDAYGYLHWFRGQKNQSYILLGFICVILLVWQTVSVLRLYPHYEAYFNEFVGGPDHGGKILVDSNIDWGQDLPELKQLLADMGIAEVNLSYFGSAPPEAYDLKYNPIPGFIRFTAGTEISAYNPYTPLPGWYAISETSVRLGLIYQNPEMYAFFQDQEPVSKAGYSIGLYEVSYPDTMPDKRVRVTGQPVSDLEPDQLGVRPGERVIVKWTQSPETQILLPEDVTYPVGFQNNSAEFEGAFRLLGYQLNQTEIQPGETVEISLYWQKMSGEVDAPKPILGPPLAAFVHLTGEDAGQIVAQYDGWGAAITGLEDGDVVVQHVALPVPENAPAGIYYLRTGLYSPQTSDRLKVRIEGRETDFVILSPISLTE